MMKWNFEFVLVVTENQQLIFSYYDSELYFEYRREY